MTALEFGEWWALYRYEPWSEVRADIAAGVIAATIANVNRGENTKTFGPSDFAPYLKPREKVREMTHKEMVEEARRRGR